jgi:hypothetical protein
MKSAGAARSNPLSNGATLRKLAEGSEFFGNPEVRGESWRQQRLGPARRCGMTGSGARRVEARDPSGRWVNRCDRARGTWLPPPAPASAAGKRDFGSEISGSNDLDSRARTSRRRFGWEVTAAEEPGSHATRQPAADNRGKLSPPPTENKVQWIFTASARSIVSPRPRRGVPRSLGTAGTWWAHNDLLQMPCASGCKSRCR